MTVPNARSTWAERVDVAVERSIGSGLFEIDDRLKAETVESLSLGRLAKAQINVRTDHVFTAADAKARYHSDRRIIVRTNTAVLFDGYPVMSRLTWEGRAGEISRRLNVGEIQLVLEHVIGRLGRDEAAQIIGRYVRDALINDSLASASGAWIPASALVTGLPCVFNLDGRPNCDPTPIEVDDGTGGIRKIHVFTDDAGTDGALPWTYARVLRYLLYFYVGRDCPIDAQHLMQQTDAWALESPEGREAFQDSDHLGYLLLGKPDTLVAEAASLFEALMLASAASGVHFATESEPAGNGVRTVWRIWTAQSGAVRDLRLAAGRNANGQPSFPTAATPVAEILDANNLSASRISWDARSIASTAIVVGDVRKYEIQSELWPGWLPESGLDNVDAPDRHSAKSAALSETQIVSIGDAVKDDPWFRKYHRSGEEFPKHWKVGRLWVLNEAGTYAKADYARNSPFDVYAPFDFSTVSTEPWMRRRRRLLPLDQPPGGEQRVIVEISFDAGATWTTIESGYSTLPDEAAIWFDLLNPLSAAPRNNEGTNLWYALVEQKCRVRVRAMIESDQRLVVRVSSLGAPSLLSNATVAYEPERFRFARYLGGNHESWVGPVEESRDRDDSKVMQTFAKTQVAANGARSVAGSAVIPWLDTQYRIGDRLIGVRGRGVSFETERSPSRQHACVVGKRYHFGPGRFETELLLGPADESNIMGGEG